MSREDVERTYSMYCTTGHERWDVKTVRQRTTNRESAQLLSQKLVALDAVDTI